MYLTNYLKTNDNPIYNTRACGQNNIRRSGARTKHLEQSFSPFCVNEWHKQDKSLRKAESIKHRKSVFKEFFNLKQKSLFAIHDSVGVKLLLTLRLKFNHLSEQKFRRNVKDAPTPMCDCGSETETTDHFFLRCPFFTENR